MEDATEDVATSDTMDEHTDDTATSLIDDIATPPANGHPMPCNAHSHNPTMIPAMRVASSTSAAASRDQPQLIGVDLLISENRLLHHTDMYRINCLLVRRGQKFDFTLETPNNFNYKQDSLIIQFKTGTTQRERDKTLILLQVGQGVDNNNLMLTEWTAVINDITDNDDSETQTLGLSVTPAPDALVGVYSMIVQIIIKQDSTTDKITLLSPEMKMFMLFNAWCQEDTVYLEADDERNEFVLNESGRIFTGKHYNVRPMAWYFGQFEKDCLLVAMHLIKYGYLRDVDMGDPVQVTRALSALANSNYRTDDCKGVLAGKWDEPYTDGKEPTEWNSSVDILQQYWSTDCMFVKYGQCWIFSGVVTTLCRTLGIPTRSVTNFESGHDCDGSMTIDYYVDRKGQDQDRYDESLWNFHVWNESWFRRPDLPAGNDGWQAFDGTPQEASCSGLFQCGPASVNAIKRGDVYLGYDAKFIFSEVNGDKVTWIIDGGKVVNIYSINQGAIGKSISTKAVGSNDRLDITHLYKHPENSEDESKAVQNALRYCNPRKRDLIFAMKPNTSSDVIFELTSSLDESTGSITTTVKSRNKSSDVRDVKIRLTAAIRQYNGANRKKILNEKVKVSLTPRKSSTLSRVIESSSYMDSISNDDSILVTLVAEIKQAPLMIHTDETFILIEDCLVAVELDKPVVYINSPVTVTTKITNVYRPTITSGHIKLHIPGVAGEQILKLKSEISPGQMVSRSGIFTPTFPCSGQEVIINFRGHVAAVPLTVRNVTQTTV